MMACTIGFRAAWCSSDLLSSFRCSGGLCGSCPAAAAAHQLTPTRLLFDISPKEEETPQKRTPWWLTLIRLACRRASHYRAAGTRIRNPPGGDFERPGHRSRLIDDGFPPPAPGEAPCAPPRI